MTYTLSIFPDVQAARCAATGLVLHVAGLVKTVTHDSFTVRTRTILVRVPISAYIYFLFILDMFYTHKHPIKTVQ
jgi:hypothetical protein